MQEIRRLIETLIVEPARLGPDFQPIHRLVDGTLMGYKASARGQADPMMADALGLLHGAQALGLVERLDWSFRSRAFDVALASELKVELHITPEPETFGTVCPPRLAVTMNNARRNLTVAAELYEDAFADQRKLDRAMDEFRSWGWKIVLADIGNDANVLRVARRLAADYVQIDLAQPSLNHPMLELAHESGSAVMALNVDTPRRRDEAVELGATLARGLLFGSKADLPAVAN
jgi:EAL domain-containing protein (putative c-di-GMP-specific phosphodiesterase class I)